MPLINECCVVSDVSPQFFLPRELVINFNQLAYRVTSNRTIDPLLLFPFREHCWCRNVFYLQYLYWCVLSFAQMYFWNVQPIHIKCYFPLTFYIFSPSLSFSCVSQNLNCNLLLCILLYSFNSLIMHMYTYTSFKCLIYKIIIFYLCFSVSCSIFFSDILLQKCLHISWGRFSSLKK